MKRSHMFVTILPLVLAKQCTPGEFECSNETMLICSNEGQWVRTDCPPNAKCNRTAYTIGCSLRNDETVLSPQKQFSSQKKYITEYETIAKNPHYTRYETEKRESIPHQGEQKTTKHGATSQKSSYEASVGEIKKSGSDDNKIKIEIDVANLKPKDANKKKIEDTKDTLVTVETEKTFEKRFPSKHRSFELPSEEEHNFLKLIHERENLVNYLKENDESLLMSPGFLKGFGERNSIISSYAVNPSAKAAAANTCGAAQQNQSACQKQAQANSANQSSCAQKAQQSCNKANQNQSSCKKQAQQSASAQNQCSAQAQAASSSAKQQQAAAQQQASSGASSQREASMQQQAVRMATENSRIAEQNKVAQQELAASASESINRNAQQAKANTFMSYQNRATQQQESKASFQSEQRAALLAKANKDTAFQNKAAEEIVESAITGAGTSASASGSVEREDLGADLDVGADTEPPAVEVNLQPEAEEVPPVDQDLIGAEQDLAAGDQLPEPEELPPTEITAEENTATGEITMSEPIPIDTITPPGRKNRNRKRKICAEI